MIGEAQETFAAKVFDRERWARLADGLAVALAVSLPWSTSATGILVALWLVALVPTLDVASVRRELATPAGGLPVLLWALGVIGMAWANVPLSERLAGLGSFHKLLCIPLLMAQFRRSDCGRWVMIGFLVSCSLLLATSWLLELFPSLQTTGKPQGIPVKDYISQSTMFTACIFMLVYVALDRWRDGHKVIALMLVLLAVMFLLNIFQVSTSRTALVVIPILLLLFGFKQLTWKGMSGLIAIAVVLTTAAWPVSSNLQLRVTTLFNEVRNYRPDAPLTSASERLEFWKKSVGFIADAPVIGHGTGSIGEQFRQSIAGQTGVGGLAAANPHNQTLAVAIQLGFIGTALLFAMWASHLLLFRGTGLAPWIGMVVVVQNIVSSLFNSHLFDFTHGWAYVVGVGIAGGFVLRNARNVVPS